MPPWLLPSVRSQFKYAPNLPRLAPIVFPAAGNFAFAAPHGDVARTPLPKSATIHSAVPWDLGNLERRRPESAWLLSFRLFETKTRRA